MGAMDRMRAIEPIPSNVRNQLRNGIMLYKKVILSSQNLDVTSGRAIH